MRIEKLFIICASLILIPIATFYFSQQADRPAAEDKSDTIANAQNSGFGETSTRIPSGQISANVDPKSMGSPDLHIYVLDVVSGCDTDGGINYKILINLWNTGKENAVVVNYEVIERAVAELEVLETRSGKIWGVLSPFPADPSNSSFSINIPPAKRLTLAFRMPPSSFFQTPQQRLAIEFKHPSFDQSLSRKFVMYSKGDVFYCERLPYN